MKDRIIIDGVAYVRVDRMHAQDLTVFGMDMPTIAALRGDFIRRFGEVPRSREHVRAKTIEPDANTKEIIHMMGGGRS